MRNFLSIILLFIFCDCESQIPNSIRAKVKSPFSKIELLQGYDSTTCFFDYENSITSNVKEVAIVGDTTCKGKNRSYLVVSEKGIRLVEIFNISNPGEVDSQLIKLDKSPKARAEAFKGYMRLIDTINQLKKNLEEAEVKAEEKLFALYRQKNLVLYEFSWDYDNEYSSAFDIEFSVINPYQKKIKYISFVFKPYNAVDDPVADEISRVYSKTVQGIGPIEYKGSATYKFERAFYSTIVSYIKILSIKIQFFDGTTKTIPNPQEIIEVLK